jgi:hypothetical protein
MKLLIILIICFLSTKSYCQFNKSFSLITSVNFDFKTKGLATNEAGAGISLDAIVFAKHKLQLLIETSADQFIGDKSFAEDAQGRENKSATIYTIKAGPQFFLSKRIALSTTIGPAWHSIEAVGFTRNYGFKFTVTGFLGHKRKLVTNLFMVDIPKDNLNIQYFGLQLGFRFH